MSNLGRLITNKRGDYLWLTSTNTSRFQGWFLRFEDDLIKVVDNLEVSGDNSTEERFFLAPYNPAFHYEIDRTQFVKIDLDIRRSYSNPKWGRDFKIEQEENKIFIYYKHSKSQKDTPSSQPRKSSDYPCLPAVRRQAGQGRSVSAQRLSAPTKFCVVLKMPQKSFFVRLNDWVEKKYPYDKKRNSSPYNLYVYRSLKVKTDSFTLAAGPSKDEALANLHYAKKDKKVGLIREGDQIKRKNTVFPKVGETQKGEDTKENVFRHNFLNEIKKRAQNSLQSLLVLKNEDASRQKSSNSALSSDKFARQGTSASLQAGLPWFFQFWSRDELISLKGLASVDSEATLAILKKNLDLIREDGRLPNIRPSKLNKEANESTDAVGWLFVRARQFLAGDYPDFPHHSQFSIKASLEAAINGLLREHTESKLAVNAPGETWMDTIYKGDKRSGARLEVQALRLNMYHLAYELFQEKHYKELEQNLKQKIRDIFWSEEYLQDGKNDSTVRPNIFLAYYTYPQLLSEDEWMSCFDRALDCLWSDWSKDTRSTKEHSKSVPLVQKLRSSMGGLASIEKNHPLYHPEHTGEEVKSYHRGDSWFWINNLAAYSLARLDSGRYRKYIQKIINASVVDLLEGQIPGHCSELSSASNFSPAGSPCQAWSAATLIELINALEEQGFVD